MQNVFQMPHKQCCRGFLSVRANVNLQYLYEMPHTAPKWYLSIFKMYLINTILNVPLMPQKRCYKGVLSVRTNVNLQYLYEM